MITLGLLRILSLAAVVCLAAPSFAAPRPLALSYIRGSGAEQCPDERWIRQAVSARLGHDPFLPEAETRVEARITRGPKGLVGSLILTGADGTRLGRRELASATGDCLELASAMELAIAIAVDPQHLSHPSTPEIKPVPAAEPPQAALTPPPSVPAPKPLETPPPPGPTRVDLHGGAGILATYGLSPSVTAGLVLRFSVRWLRFSLGAEGRADLPSTATWGTGRATSWVLLGSLTPCLHFGRFGTCGVVSAGAIQVTGQIAAERRESSPLILAGVREQLDFALTEMVALQPFIGVAAVITRTTVLSAETPIWVTSLIHVNGGLAIDLHFL